MTHLKALFFLKYNIIFINHKFSKKNINIAKKRKFIFIALYNNPQEKSILSYQKTNAYKHYTYYII